MLVAWDGEFWVSAASTVTTTILCHMIGMFRIGKFWSGKAFADTRHVEVVVLDLCPGNSVVNRTSVRVAAKER